MPGRTAHALRQELYVARKSATHKRVAHWVPKKKVAEFKTASEKLLKKWDKNEHSNKF